MVRYRIGVLFLLLTAACGSIKTAIPTATALPTKPTNPTAVARVYNTEISIGDFQIMVRFIRFQLIYQYNHFERLARLNSSVPKTRDYYLSQSKDIANQLTDYQGIGGEALSHMVNDKLIRQEAQKRDITVNPEEIDSRLREFFNYFPEGTPTPIGTPGPTATPYTEQAYASDLAAYLSDLKNQAGVSEVELRTYIESQILIEKMSDVIGASVPTSAELVHARQILVSDEATANVVLNQLKAGEDWNKLVVQYSIDTITNKNNGDLGWFGRGVMIPEIDAAAFEISANSIIGPIQSQYGWHIIQVVERGIRPLPREQIIKARQTKLDEWLNNQIDGKDANGKPLVEFYDYWTDYIPTNPMLP
jgi:parvulin-like peptidyl-prolyl isomerase